MTQYSRTISAQRGDTYAKLVADVWVEINEDEAKAAGVWRDPRGGQYGVKDALGTPEELRARYQGSHDPRPASGEEIAVRVNLYCRRCYALVGRYVEFEKRSLFYSVRDERWTRLPSHLKCSSCYEKLEPFVVDLDAITDAAERARIAGKPKSLKIGKVARRNTPPAE